MNNLCEDIFKKAHAEAMKAVEKLNVIPMIAQIRANPFDDSSKILNEYYIADGVCGFAWVIIKPSNCKFAKFLVSNNLARKVTSGISYSIRDFNQSMQKKEAYAYAFAKVLQNEGIKAYAESRID